MYRPWPTTSLAALSLVLACSNAGTELLTDSQSSSGDTGNETTNNPTNNPTNDPTSDPTGPSSSPTEATSDTPTSSPTTDPTDTQTSTVTATTSEPSETDTDTSTGGSTADTTTGTTGDTTGTTGTTGDSSSSTGLPAGCDDGELNGDETDIDCGGSCSPCALDLVCILDGDCASGSCELGVCVEATCDDGKTDGLETDIDCGGGECDVCLEGDSCAVNEDCNTGVCDKQICQAPACDDGVKNGEETDLDCGGPTCEPCGEGLACVVNDDCDSGVCDNDLCTAPSCNDGLQNGEEAGIDCGGPSCDPCRLVINELDYDSVGADTSEFIEILNKEPGPVSLAGIQVVLVNGADNKTYKVVDLAPAVSLAAGQYLVLASPNFVVPPAAKKIDLGAQDQVQNGSPDGIALIDLANKKLLDALSYEGAMTMATVTGLGVVSLVEGTALKATTLDDNATPGSLARLPDGTDTNNADTDWALSKNITPGAANLP